MDIRASEVVPGLAPSRARSLPRNEISVIEGNGEGWTVTKPFPRELYLAFLDDELTTEQFVAALVSHGQTGNGA